MEFWAKKLYFNAKKELDRIGFYIREKQNRFCEKWLLIEPELQTKWMSFGKK